MLMDEAGPGKEVEMRRTRQLSVVSFQLSLSSCTIRPRAESQSAE